MGKHCDRVWSAGSATESPHYAHRPVSALILVNNGDLLRGLLVLHH